MKFTNMEKPKYDLQKIKYATNQRTFEKAIGLYESRKVKNFRDIYYEFSAVVSGTQNYNVHVSKNRFDEGGCDCYLGQHEILCKHMITVAIYGVSDGKKLKKDEKEIISGPVCSGIKGILGKEELSEVKKRITSALKYVKSYVGPSRTWFAYQNSLSEGCAMLSGIVANLPISKQTADILVNLLLRLDKKLCTGGVDDSDGAVGGFMEETVLVLEEYVKIDKDCVNAFDKLINIDSCFEWEEPLVKLIKSLDNI